LTSSDLLSLQGLPEQCNPDALETPQRPVSKLSHSTATDDAASLYDPAS
jgi:hypothetical protein